MINEINMANNNKNVKIIKYIKISNKNIYIL